MYDMYNGNKDSVWYKCWYSFYILPYLKKDIGASDEQMLELVKKYDLCKFIADNVDYFDEAGPSDCVKDIKEYLRKQGWKG